MKGFLSFVLVTIALLLQTATAVPIVSERSPDVANRKPNYVIGDSTEDVEKRSYTIYDYYVAEDSPETENVDGGFDCTF
ncbi:hypothetical protein K503DRAFT_804274 [Rhizopogon vinicolor AM-OR11-026]|uniref:Uncharacterized protein n=1 Tax=Rhizopogon vinicolor AM-OR11-026 TaxID=1314800 RepID=A0A1B7MLT8_9AGAM|nr:hypothetical protein K503DRAFT_804274 [Rhizopogon vinicolor AM-OR11-026]